MLLTFVASPLHFNTMIAGLPAELRQEIVARLSWPALKAGDDVVLGRTTSRSPLGSTPAARDPGSAA
jgi:hypothetical protein